jgi:hypothetical protein
MALFATLSIAGCAVAASDESEDVDGEETGATASALSSNKGKLKKVDKALFWSGSVGPSDVPDSSFPPECQAPGVQCDHFQVKVQLPGNAFSNPNKPGGVQFAVQWYGDPGPHQLPPGVPGCCGEFDALNLYVYKNGTLRGSSVGIIATAVAATIPSAENGTYDVYIASDPTYNIHPTVEYDAYARVQYQPAIHPTKPLLPDLQIRSARTVTFDTPSFPLFEPDPPPGNSCFDSETAETGATNCLRFDQVIANAGKGAAELRFALPHDPNDTSREVNQRIYRSDGSSYEQGAGEWEFHDIHQHYHYTNFTISELWKSNKYGHVLGSQPVKTSEKVSFCVADIEIDRWGKDNVHDRRYFAPDCLFPTASDENYDYLVQGIGAGWNDIYEWYLPGQYIEVSGVANGYYVLRSCTDPDGTIDETKENNNCADNLIKLSHMGTPNQHAENLGEVNNCN